MTGSKSRRVSARMVVPVLLVVFLATITVTALSMKTTPPHNGLTTTTTTSGSAYYPTKNLPPSHDNDAGRARALDATPDADTDAWQR